MEMLLPGFIMLQVLCFVSGYPSGAPTGACEDMLPRHSGVQPQPSPAPYALLTNTKTFEPGKPITGEMSTKTTATNSNIIRDDTKMLTLHVKYKMLNITGYCLLVD